MFGKSWDRTGHRLLYPERRLGSRLLFLLPLHLICLACLLNRICPGELGQLFHRRLPARLKNAAGGLENNIGQKAKSQLQRSWLSSLHFTSCENATLRGGQN